MNFAKNEKRIDELKRRVKSCCCRYCGSKLQLRRIIYGNTEEGRVEIFCSQCNRIEYGVQKEIYLAAKYFVDEFGRSAGQLLDDRTTPYRQRVCNVCNIMTWGLTALDLMDHEGFKVPVTPADKILAEEVIFDEKDLDDTDLLIEQLEI